MRSMFLLGAFAALLIAGCTSAPMTVRATPADGVSVEYLGTVGDAKTSDFAEWEGGGSPDEGATVRIEARVVRVPAERAARDLGQPIVPAALSLTADQVAALSTGEGSLLHGSLSAPVLTIYNRQSGMVEVHDETAYVGGFEIRSQGGAWVADPVIHTLKSGISLRVRPTIRNDGEIEVAAHIVVSEPVRPIDQCTVLVLGAPMSVQTPTCMTQRLGAWGVMRKDRVLLLTGLLSQGGDVLLVLLKGSAEGTPAPYLEPIQPKKD